MTTTNSNISDKCHCSNDDGFDLRFFFFFVVVVIVIIFIVVVVVVIDSIII